MVSYVNIHLMRGSRDVIYHIKKHELVPTLHHMKIASPLVARKAMPGQFVILRIDEHGERIPLTIADVTGPLGNPSEIRRFGTVVCVGGGVGIAPIFPIARALEGVGNRVISIIGARSADILFWEDRMDKASSKLYVATDDGMEGHHGFVTDVVQKMLECGERGEQIDRVIAIGPPVMMRAVAGVTKPFGVKTVVSLNPIRMDGTGMCGACRVLVGNETKFACVDGPEHALPADIVILAIGTFPNPLVSMATPELETARYGTIRADEAGATSKPGVFAGGDIVTGSATVIPGVGRRERCSEGYR